MELLSEVESLCDSLFWDRADVGKRLASLRKLQTAVTCEGAPPPHSSAADTNLTVPTTFPQLA